MNPSDFQSVMQEISRLRHAIESTDQRHAMAVSQLRQEISELESSLRRETPQVAAEIVAPQIPEPTAPPPLASARPDWETVEKSVTATAADDESTELSLGKNWFVRIGVVVLITGLVFLGNYAYQNWIRETSNGVRLAALVACALALAETGRRIAARPAMRNFGDVLLAGGMAFLYYCTYAANHVPRLKVIENPVLAALLLLAAATGIAFVAWRRDSKAIATLGFVLATYATMLQPLGWLSCVSNVLIAAGGLACFLRPGWATPGWASMLGSYGAFLGWQISGLSGARLRPEDPVQLWFLAPLWVMFALPGVLDHFRETLSERARFWFTAANNSVFFLLFSWVWAELFGWENYWQVPAVFGPVLLVLGTFGRSRKTAAGNVNIAQGLAFTTLALALKLKGFHLPLALAAESLVLAVAAFRFRTMSEKLFSVFAGSAAALLLCQTDSGTILTYIPYDPLWVAIVAVFLLGAASCILKSAGSVIGSTILTLATALVATFALSTFLATHWIDTFAFLAIVALAVSFAGKLGFLPGSALLLGLAAVGLVQGVFMGRPWEPQSHPGWDGILVILAVGVFEIALALKPAVIGGRRMDLTGTAAALLAMWATQQLVWRFDWHPAAVLWTLLGFTFVSLGLWRGVGQLRGVGITLLVLALGKLFLLDVWDFSAFMRVISFILLGVCLILLGLFYNRFSLALTTLMKERGKSQDGDA